MKKIIYLLLIPYFVTSCSTGSKLVKNIDTSDSRNPTAISSYSPIDSIKFETSDVESIEFQKCGDKIYYSTDKSLAASCKTKKNYWGNLNDLIVETTIYSKDKANLSNAEIRITKDVPHNSSYLDMVRLNISNTSDLRSTFIISQVQKCFDDLKNKKIQKVKISENTIYCRKRM